jgi:hypothetical protein
VSDAFAPWRFLLGKWIGQGGGKPGEAEAGGFAFTIELQGKVLVRRNWARYAATAGRRAFMHEDLLYVYPEGDGWRADYWDSEGQVIHYRAAADGRAANFESDGATRYRLRYDLRDGALAFTFEVAPPGREFAAYVSGTAAHA